MRTNTNTCISRNFVCSNFIYNQLNKMSTRLLSILIFLLTSTFSLTAQTKTTKPFSIGEIATIKSVILK